MEPVETAETTKPVGPPIALHIGLDVGQKVDPTAIVVAEVAERDTDRTYEGYKTHPVTGEAKWNFWYESETVYTVRHMERLPLGMSYVDIAQRVVTVLKNLHKREWEQRLRGELAGDLPRRLYVDATGVGAPFLDILKPRIRAQSDAADCQVIPLTFTHGDQYDRSGGKLGKAYLVSHLQALMQTRCIKLPPGHVEAEAMARELKDYEIKIDADANDKYGAFRVGSHDDLVTSLGLATLDDPSYYRVQFAYMPW